jgi:hypothetical protein
MTYGQRQTVVRIWWDLKISAYRLSFPYNKELVELLKDRIPVSDRSFDDASRTWIFNEKQLDFVQNILKFVNAQVKLTSRADAEAHASTSHARSSSRSPVDTAIIEFVRLTPYSAMQKAFRFAQMELHPDKGGDPDKSARLNAAWERVKKEVYNQQ